MSAAGGDSDIETYLDELVEKQLEEEEDPISSNHSENGREEGKLLACSGKSFTTCFINVYILS